MPTEIDEILAQLSMPSGTVPEHVLRYKPDPLAQAMELRQRLAVLNTRAAFKPGDIIRSKPGIGPFKDDKRVVLVVVRMLDWNDSYDAVVMQEAIRAKGLTETAVRLDIVTANLMQSGGSMLVLDLAASVWFEHISDEELAAWTTSSDSE